MQLRLFRRFWRQGRLSFYKYGELDYTLHALPENQTLFIDIDCQDDDVCNIRHINSMVRVIGLHPQVYCYAKTRRGWHIAIVFEETFSELERISLQSIFGDDSFRAALNFMRYWQSKGKSVPKFWKSRSNLMYKRKLQ
jgi:hypothetical protein